MDELTRKISKFLFTNPNSNARDIGKEVGFSKNAVNSCLYADKGAHFLKEGLKPPLWRNTGDISQTGTVKTELAVFDHDESNEDLEVENKDSDEDQDEDWTRLNAEDQEIYLVIKTCITFGAKLSKEDRRRMNQLKNRIRKSERNKESLVERQEYKSKNRAKYAAEVNEKVNKMWKPDEQRKYAVEALSLKFNQT